MNTPTFGVPSIPPPDREYAVTHGVAAENLAQLWRSHCEGSQERGYQTVGGLPWRRYVDAAVRAANEAAKAPRMTPDARALEERRMAEQRAKAIQAAAYDRESVSLGDYLASLGTKPQPTPVELALVASEDDYSPRVREVDVWILDALTKRRPEPLPGHCRRCGLPNRGTAMVGGTRPIHFSKCQCPGGR